MSSPGQNVILNTKLQKPFLPDDFIPRERLLTYLNSQINRPLTLISAGAGFGKSTFVSSWLEEVDFKHCWFSVDEQDNDIRSFLSYFIASVQTVIPDFGSNIDRNIYSPNISSLSILTNNLINDLSVLKEDIILVLDDFQNITNLEITNLISNILKYPPEKFHLVIISRTDPALPLHKLRAADKMKDIRSSHLRLTDEEINIFLRNNFNIKNDEHIISLFNNKFEGWVTGIRLLKIHLSYTDFDVNKLERYIQSSSLSETYFLEELIKQVDDETLEFLLKTSILLKFNSELAGFVLSTKDKKFYSKNIIRELQAKNLFLINLDNSNDWFRYHHMFQDALTEELKKTYDRQSIIDILNKAIEWFIANDLYEEAFYHSIKTKDTDAIANFVKTYMYMPLNVNKWFILEKWLKHIPDDIINECPVLLTAQMWVMQHKGVYWIIPELIKRVEEVKDNNIELYNKIKHQLVFFEAIINFWNANLKESVEQFDYVRKRMTFDKLGALSLSSIYYATASQLNGNGTKVYKEIQSEISRKKLPADYQFILFGALLYIKLLEGDLYKAEQLIKRIGKLILSTDNNFYVVWYEFYMGYIALMQYRIDDAVTHFKNTLKLVYLLNTHGPVDAFAGALLALKQTNRNKEFDQINEELTSFVDEWNNPTFNTIAHSLKARVSVIDNDLPKAWEEFNKTEPAFDLKTIIFNIEVPRITYCKLLLKEDSVQMLDEAINKLDEIYDFVTQIHNVPQTIDVLILLSVAFYKKNNMPQAVEKLSEAVALAEKGRFIYPFIEQSETVKELLPEIKTDKEYLNPLCI
jgi:LuxR family maltose regulon positive regulatory protein